MKIIRKNSQNGRRNGGFSLSEMLLVVAIIAILAAVGFVNGVDMIRGSRQTAMDRQAEQIYLALSRNLQGIEASGNTALLQSEVERICDEGPDWLIPIDKPLEQAAGKYAFYQTGENPAADDLKKLLFPTDGLSAALSAELDSGCWLVIFTPGMEEESDILENKTYGPVIGKQLYVTRPAVYHVFFAQNEEAAKGYFQKLLAYADETSETPVAAGVNHYKERSERLKDFEGYVGYYGGGTQSLKAMPNQRYDKFRCGMEAPINAEILSVPVWCEIPNVPEYTNRNITFTLKATGKTSAAEIELVESTPSGLDGGKKSTFFVLDKLGAEQLGTKENPGNRNLRWRDVLTNSGFIPGEDLYLTLSAECNIYETEDNSRKTVNSLFADGTNMESGVLTAKIAYGRHLQNLNRGTSGAGEDSRVTQIKAEQIRDIHFSGPYPSGTESYEKWADTYDNNGAPKTFLPILNRDSQNDKLLSYDGGNYTIYNLTVNYENLAADNSSNKDDNKENAGLFSSFGGSEIKNLTLAEPHITGVGDTENIGGVAGICDAKEIGDATTLQNLTLIDPLITGVSATTKTAGGLVGALSMKNGVAIEQCALYLDADTSAEKRTNLVNTAKNANERPRSGMSWLTAGAGNDKNVGGLLGSVTGDGKTLSITGSFASTVIKAGVETEADAWGTHCHAGGLAGLADEGVKVSIDRCYTGSYIYGQYTGGLVGYTRDNASVSVTNSYTAGFQYSGLTNVNKADWDAWEPCAAGLVNGAVSELKSCYTVAALNHNKRDNHSKYMAAVKLASGARAGDIERVFYRITDKQLNDNNIYGKFGGADLSDMDELQVEGGTLGKWYQNQKNIDENLNDPDDEAFVSWSVSDGGGNTTRYDTNRYNLDKQNLLNYTYPRLNLKNDVTRDDMRAYYGDWKPELGILAYYEIYHYDETGDYYKELTEEQQQNGEYRFAVESLDCLYTGDELEAAKGKITADGYGILFEGETQQLTSTIKKLTVSFGGIKTDGTSISVTEGFDVPLNNFQTINVDGIDYVLYPIAQDKINRALFNSDSNVNENERTFYQWAKIVQKDNGEDSGEKSKRSYYRFNPHFARTATMISDPELADPENQGTTQSWKDTRTDLVLNDDEFVSVRTARQLHALSRYYETDYYPILKDNGTRVTFKQECDIDYRAYNWDDYAPQYLPDGVANWNSLVPWETYATNSTHYSAESQNRERNDWEKAAFTQRPIAETQSKAFVNVYDGDCRVITGVSVMAKTDTGGGEKAIGLFGWNQGTLENIVFAAPFDRDDANSPYVVGRARDIGYGGLNETVYLGVLAGHNAGEIRNCAAAGYYLSMSDVFQTGTNERGMRDPSKLWNESKAAADNNQIWVGGQSTLYAGGFVGYNDTQGKISNASSSAPRMFTYIHIARAYTGGFAGWNDGQISYAYGIGWVDAESSQQTSELGYETSLAGFCAGSNGTHSISNSYCAVAITGAGTFTHTNAFAPRTAQVTFSYYLQGPVSKYLNDLHNYDAPSERGTPRNESELRKLGASYAAESERWHDMPESEQRGATDGGGYLYPAYVTRTRNGATERCHYGNWLGKQSLGQMGLFYWEHEEGGSNAGYHISFLGVDYDKESEDAKPVTGSTLCVRHNDGGVIQTYGYGYYQMIWNVKAGHQVNLNLQNIAYSKNVVSKPAKGELEEQWPDYYFYPYTTRASGDDYIYMSGGEAADKKSNVRNGSMTLNLPLGNGVTLQGQYEVSPFFANALRISKINGQNASDCFTEAGVLENGGKATRTKYFNKDLGGIDNRYEIRSLRQLQYLNWNYETKDTTRLATPENKGQFNYLTYWSGPENVDGNHSNVNNDLKDFYWWQTHDAAAPGPTSSNSLDQINKTPVEMGGALFTPIAGSTVSSSRSETNAQLLAWFGGRFDGQSYTLKNIEVHSDSFNVGVFGTTVSESIENIILYSDRNNVVERVTNERIIELTGRPQQVLDDKKREKLGAYLLGGLIGLAYSYEPNSDSLTIKNCSIAGYRILDSSTNPHGRGGGNIGGLFGSACAQIVNCSSVADIYVNCMPVLHERGGIQRAQYGSYIHIGGLVGAIQFNATNCYTGGNIYVSEETLYSVYFDEDYKTETIDGKVYMIDNYQIKRDADGAPLKDGSDTIYEITDPDKKLDKRKLENLSPDDREYYRVENYLSRIPENKKTVARLRREDNLHLHIGGIAGSTYSPNYTNFGRSNANRRSTFENCYTYINLPVMEGNIRSVSYIGGVADRFTDDNSATGSKVKQINCWYLNGISDDAKDAEAAQKAGKNYKSRVPANRDWYIMLTGPGQIERTATRNERSLEDFEEGASASFTDKGIDTTRHYLYWSADGSAYSEKYPERTLENILLGNLDGMRSIHYLSPSVQDPWQHCDPNNLPKKQSYSMMKDENSENGMRYKLNINNDDGQWKPVTNASGTANLEGRYSFPGGNAPQLLGADYPFPTILKQYDPVSKDVVSVHYGSWPLDGAYWQAYMATMDIFGDMNPDSEGPDGGWWAEKEFTLCDVELTQTGDDAFTGEPVKENFTFSDSAVAELVSVSEPINLRQASNTNRYYADYEVTIRALKRGNTQVVYTYDKTVDTVDDDGNSTEATVSQERKFNLTVTASGIETGGTFTAGDPETLAFASDKDSADGNVEFTLYARRKRPDEASYNPAEDLYFTKAVGDWSGTRTGLELDRALPMQNGRSDFLNDISDGELVDVDSEDGTGIHYRARTNGTPGEYYINSTFTYDYHSDITGVKLEVPVTTESLYTFGSLGLSNGKEYYGGNRVSDNNDVSVGKVTFTSRQQKPAAPENTSLFLYETATDAVRVTEKAGTDDETEMMVPALQKLKLQFDQIRLTDADPDKTNGQGNRYPYPLKVILDGETWYIMPSEDPKELSAALSEDDWKGLSPDKQFSPVMELTFDDAGNVVRNEGDDYQRRGVYVVRRYVQNPYKDPYQHPNDTSLPQTFELTLPVVDPNALEKSDAVYPLKTTINIGGNGVNYNNNEEDPTPVDPVDPVDPDPVIVTPGGGSSGSGSGSGGSSGGYNYGYFVILRPNGGAITWGERTIEGDAYLKLFSVYRNGQDEVTLPENIDCDRDDYEFTGWNTEPDGSGKDYFKDDPKTSAIPSNLTLYAQWALKACKIEFYANKDDCEKGENPIYEITKTSAGSEIKPGDLITMPSLDTILQDPEIDNDDFRFFIEWLEYRSESPDELFSVGETYTFTGTGTKRFYPDCMPESVPIRMEADGEEEEHYLTVSDDYKKVSIDDSYPTPALPGDATPLGWYDGVGTDATEILTLAEWTSDGWTPLDELKVNINADGLYELYKLCRERNRQITLSLRKACEIEFYANKNDCASGDNLIYKIIKTDGGAPIQQDDEIAIPDTILEDAGIELPFFLGWLEYDSENPDAPSPVGDAYTFTETGTKRLYPKQLREIPVYMTVNSKTETHYLTINDDNATVTFDNDNYQDPFKDVKNVSLLGWYLSDETTEVLCADNEGNLSPADGIDAQWAFERYQASGPLTLYNKCSVRLPRITSSRGQPPLDDKNKTLETNEDGSFDANGSKFYWTFDTVDFQHGDKLTIKVNLPTDETVKNTATYKDNGNYNPPNLIALGKERADITNWGKQNQVLIYYPTAWDNNGVSNNSVRVAINAYKANDAKVVGANTSGQTQQLEITFTKDKVSFDVNGTKTEIFFSGFPPNKNFDWANSSLSKLYVGSMEGGGRSYATDYVITLERTEESINSHPAKEVFNQSAEPGATTFKPTPVDEPDDSGQTPTTTNNSDDTTPDNSDETPTTTDDSSETPTTPDNAGLQSGDGTTDGHSQTEEATTNNAAAAQSVPAPDSDAALYGGTSPADADSDAALYGWTPEENPGMSDENPGTTKGNPGTSDENPATTDENPATTDENPATTDENSGTTDENPENELPAGWNGS